MQEKKQMTIKHVEQTSGSNVAAADKATIEQTIERLYNEQNRNCRLADGSVHPECEVGVYFHGNDENGRPIFRLYDEFADTTISYVYDDGTTATFKEVDFVDDLKRGVDELNDTMGKKLGLTFNKAGRVLDKPIVRVLVSSEAAISTLMQAVAIEDANLTPGVDANTESKPTRDISMEEFLGATLQ
jgi:hypothetical protein